MSKKDEKPSVYTNLYWLSKENGFDARIFFDFLELFWPTFMRKDSYIFLKENYVEEQFKELISQKQNPEYWINLVTVDDYFSGVSNGEKEAEILAKSLVEIWQTKLKKDFPDKNFTVEYVFDREQGDCGLTFYQNK